MKPDVRESTAAVDGLVSSLTAMAGVADVRYDREWLTRLNTLVRTARIVATGIVALLALAAAMTVGNVVRLTAAARRDEIEIMQLVGAPFAYVRGPFVAEGILQGGLGALVALIALTVGVLFRPHPIRRAYISGIADGGRPASWRNSAGLHRRIRGGAAGPVAVDRPLPRVYTRFTQP